MLRVPGFIDALVSKDSALSFPVVAKRLNPKRLTAKKIRVNLERTPLKKHLNVSLEVNWIETPVRKAISTLKTRRPTHRLIFNEVAKVLVF